MKKDTKKSSSINYDAFEAEALKALQEGKGLSGKDNPFTSLYKRLIEKSLDAELDHHLLEGDGDPARRNRRNGRTSKQVKTDRGSIEIETPRDRESSFEPQLIKKRQTTLGPFLEDKILGLYAMGVSYADIRETALLALRHRVLLNFEAEADRIDPDDVVKKIIELTPTDPVATRVA